MNNKLLALLGIVSLFGFGNIKAQEIHKDEPKMETGVYFSSDLEGKYGFKINNSFEYKNFSESLIANLHQTGEYNFSKLSFGWKKSGIKIKNFWIGPQISSGKNYEERNPIRKELNQFFQGRQLNTYVSADLSTRYNFRNFSGSTDLDFVLKRRIGFYTQDAIKTKIGKFEFLARFLNGTNYSELSWTGKNLGKTFLSPYVKLCSEGILNKKGINFCSLEAGIALIVKE